MIHIIIDILMIIAVIISAIVTSPDSVCKILEGGITSVILTLGILWTTAGLVRLATNNHPRNSLICSSFVLGFGFLMVSFGLITAIIFAIIYIFHFTFNATDYKTQ